MQTHPNYAKMTLAELLAAYIERAGEPVKKFKSKKAAIEALEALDGKPERATEAIPEEVAEKVKSRKRKPFIWPVKDEIKPHRAGTKRAFVVETLTTTGATFDEVAEHCGWDKPTCYEGIKLIHSALGYGLFEDTSTGIIRAFSDKEEYDNYVAKMAA